MMSYFINLLFSASLWLLGAIVVSLIFRRASASFRHKLWNFTMIGLLLLPMLVPFMPQHTLGVLPMTAKELTEELTPPPVVLVPYYMKDDIQYFPAGTSKSYTTPDLQRTENEWERCWMIDKSTNKIMVSPVPPLPAKQETPGLLTLFTLLTLMFLIDFGLNFGTGILMAVTFILLLRLIFSFWSAWRLLRRMLPIESESVQKLAGEVARRMWVHRRIVLLQNEVGTVPFTLGLRTPKIVVPRVAVENWSEPQLRAILAHEIAHIQRGDVWGQLLAQFVFCLYWFHPLVWFTAWRIRVTRELACDDMVLFIGEEPADFAEILLELANAFSSKNRFALGCGVAMFERKSLVRKRVTSILNRKARRVPLGVFATLVLLLLTIMGVAFASILSPFAGKNTEKITLQDIQELREQLKTLEPTPEEKVAISRLRQSIHDQSDASLKELKGEQICMEIRFFSIKEPFRKTILANKALDWTGLPVPDAHVFTKEPLSKNNDFLSLPNGQIMPASMNLSLIPNQSDPKPGLCSLTTFAPSPLHVRFMEKNNARHFCEIFQSHSSGNCLQAPKITMVSGEIWCIHDTSQRPFVTSVIPVESDEGNTAYQPIIQIFHEGMNVKGKATLLEDHSCRLDSCVAEFTSITGVETVQLQEEEKKGGVCVQVPTVRSYGISIPEIVIPEGMSLLVAVPGTVRASAETDPIFLVITPNQVNSDK
ncbi:MAG: M56 family metallopeptidase [Planctomycetaceae bacterium]|nr:M56 family metallopeptidase [Planctomycetaceae bacterium]